MRSKIFHHIKNSTAYLFLLIFLCLIFDTTYGKSLNLKNQLSKKSRFAEIIAKFSNNNLFQGTVLIKDQSNAIWTFSSGLASSDLNISNERLTTFQIGSITKQFTYAAVLLLQEQGKLNIKNPIHLYIPALKWTSEPTIEQLLNHTSGLPNLYPDSLSVVDIYKSPLESKRRLDLVSKLNTRTDPGMVVQYSNAGYVALGHLIEAVAGNNYEEFLSNYFFDRLGMRSTWMSKKNSITQLADGFRNFFGFKYSAAKLLALEDHALSYVFSAGAYASSVDDLLTWTDNFWSGKVISQASIESILIEKNNSIVRSAWVFDKSVINTSRIWTRGAVPPLGFSSYISYYPEDGATIIYLANMDSSFIPLSFAAELESLLLENVLAKDKIDLPILWYSFAFSELFVLFYSILSLYLIFTLNSNSIFQFANLTLLYSFIGHFIFKHYPYVSLHCKILYFFLLGFCSLFSLRKNIRKPFFSLPNEPFKKVLFFVKYVIIYYSLYSILDRFYLIK